MRNFETSTPKLKAVDDSQQTIMMTETGTQPEVEALRIGEEGLDEWSRHNDAELATQRNVLNLNDKTVRITLWCLVYIALTLLQINSNTYQYYFYQDVELFADEDSIDEQLVWYLLGLSANSMIQLGVLVLLCSWYCICCRANCNYCTALSLIVGGVMLFATMIYGLYI